MSMESGPSCECPGGESTIGFQFQGTVTGSGEAELELLGHEFELAANAEGCVGIGLDETVCGQDVGLDPQGGLQVRLGLAPIELGWVTINIEPVSLVDVGEVCDD